MLVHYSIELPLYLCLGIAGFLVRLLMTGIDATEVTMLPVEVPYKHLSEFLWGRVNRLEAVYVVVGNEPAVEVKELLKLLVHKGYVTVLYDLSEIAHHCKLADRLAG